MTKLEKKKEKLGRKEKKPMLLNMLYRLRKKWQYVHLIQLNITITIGSYN